MLVHLSAQIAKALLNRELSCETLQFCFNAVVYI